uniref:EGF-like domain-containing protein n=1 Tax=Wuchereria bancrofti TaxID=6293 RepID=A0A1I8EU51_WUCBA
MNILDQLAFYSRIYRIGLNSHPLRISCIDSIWNDIKKRNWRPSQALARNFTFNQTTHITLGSFDMKLFRCAKSSFCVNGCNPSPCLGNGTCVLKSSYNEDFAGIFDVNKRVDINKWLYMNCVQTHGENWESVNLKGSYSCVCKLGFNPVNNVSPGLSWKGPTLAEAIKFPLKKIVLIVCLLMNRDKFKKNMVGHYEANDICKADTE